MIEFLLKSVGSWSSFIVKRNMACSRFEYVKSFEQEDRIIPNVWVVIRIDGKKFHKFSAVHKFEKPNDPDALNLMNAAAIGVMQEFRDIIVSFGQSDEYSFVFRKDSKLFNRRASKLLTYVTSLFTSLYVVNWKQWMPSTPLQYPPCFDGRVVLYPSNENLRDYLSWRQADVHVNNLYNTAFWNLVLLEHMSQQKAEEELRGTLAADKNELLFSRFGINYNTLPAIYRKGTTLLRKRILFNSEKRREAIMPLHEDIISNKFWNMHKELLGKYAPGDYDVSCAETTDSARALLVSQFDQLSVKQEEDSCLHTI